MNANVYERVLELRTEVDRGTAFVFDSAVGQYLVSARHLFGEGSAHTVSVSNRFMQREIRVDLLPIRPPSADVAVAPLGEPLVDGSELPLPGGFGMFGFSQDLYFLGFPYGIANAPGHPAGRLAFVKKAVLSAAEEVDGVKLVYLDGHNNSGFSGGPVVGCPPGFDHHRICGVVSRYRTEELPTEGLFAGRVFVNTGIVVATQISHVLDAIARFEEDG